MDFNCAAASATCDSDYANNAFTWKGTDSYYWSSTTSILDNINVYFVDFGYGQAAYNSGATYYVRCVRSID